ncbi:MAG: LptF/LptG family permease [Rickettsiaceae bacterium]|nr:LptF/LptG family permease [Rickettsiaceae bacterium]
MLLTKTLFKYLSRMYIANLFSVLISITFCICCFNIFDLMGRLKFVILPFHDIIILSALKIPIVLSEILPISLLIASLYSLQKIAERQEIVIMLTCGVSIWKIAQPFIYCGFVISIIFITIIQPIGALCIDMQSNLERKYLKAKEGNTISVIDSGLYIFESFEEDNRIITAKIILKNEKTIKDVTILRLDPENKFRERIESQEGIFTEQGIKLGQDAYAVDTTEKKTNIPSYILPTNLHFSTIIKKFEFPENISFWKLPKLGQELSKSGINADKFVSYYYKLLLRPIYSITIILLSLCFTVVNTRGTKFIQVGYGMIAGILVHGCKELSSVIFLANGVGAFFAQFIPIVVIALVSLIAIVKIFEFRGKALSA